MITKYNEKYLLITRIMKKFLKEVKGQNTDKIHLYKAEDGEENVLAFFMSYPKDKIRFGHLKLRVKYDEDERLILVQIIEEQEVIFEKKDRELKQYLMEIQLTK